MRSSGPGVRSPSGYEPKGTSAAAAAAEKGLMLFSRRRATQEEIEQGEREMMRNAPGSGTTGCRAGSRDGVANRGHRSSGN